MTSSFTFLTLTSLLLQAYPKNYLIFPLWCFTGINFTQYKQNYLFLKIPNLSPPSLPHLPWLPCLSEWHHQPSKPKTWSKFWEKSQGIKKLRRRTGSWEYLVDFYLQANLSANALDLTFRISFQTFCFAPSPWLPFSASPSPSPTGLLTWLFLLLCLCFYSLLSSAASSWPKMNSQRCSPTTLASFYFLEQAKFQDPFSWGSSDWTALVQLINMARLFSSYRSALKAFSGHPT